MHLTVKAPRTYMHSKIVESSDGIRRDIGSNLITMTVMVGVPWSMLRSFCPLGLP